jgi:hypothetical protein
MSLFRPLLSAAIALAVTASPAIADPHPHGRDQSNRPERSFSPDEISRDQDRAFRATREGRSMPLPLIERRVMPFMGGADYLGPEFDGDTYRLKFMRDGRVIWVDVDAATGRIIRRSRP